MKTKSLLSLWVSVSFGVIAAVAGPDNAAKVRVGVYDSRAVAFAHFWGEAASEKRNALVTQVRAAKLAGDQAKFRKLDQSLRDLQASDHLKVFSSAPADEAMGALKNELRVLQIELGLVRIVSKWDEVALKNIPAANRVDLTDRLVRELLPRPTESQQKVIASMRTTKPLSLDKAKQLAAAGKL